ncbi:MAG: type II toxin-antitoxin system VapC family toxin [Vulcanimicrobiota bacterium]
MGATVYLETSVVSYLASKTSRDIIVLAHQQITRDWWASAPERFEMYISQIVIEEASLGDPEASQKRLSIIKNYPLLALNSKVEEVAALYIKELEIPPKALRDAVHLALASVHTMDYLVTWNCAHIANGEIIRKLINTNTNLGICTPVICTPEELMEVEHEK